MAASVANLRLFVLTMVGSYTPACLLSLGLPFTKSRPILQNKKVRDQTQNTFSLLSAKFVQYSP